jgi:hypothetical protein
MEQATGRSAEDDEPQKDPLAVERDRPEIL